MAMIDVVNLSFSYEGSFEEVFRNVSFRIDTDWKLGLNKIAVRWPAKAMA